MSGQYKRVRVYAQDLQERDLIEFNGSQMEVLLPPVVYLDADGDRIRADTRDVVLYLRQDTEMDIQRPDPQAERIERLCRVYYEALEHDSGNSWDHAAPWYQEDARLGMRAVLAEIDSDNANTERTTS